MNTTIEATDSAVSIMGIGDTVHLVIGLSNLGPKACDAKLNYKIPVGLKLLSLKALECMMWPVVFGPLVCC